MDDENLGDTSNEGVPGDEVTYCYCNGVSYGEMVACDRENCAREWYPWTLHTKVTLGSILNVQS